MKIGNKKELKEFKDGWKVIWKYVLKYKKYIIPIIILSIFSAILSGSIPYIMGKFFDSLIDIANEKEILGIPYWLAILILFAILQISQNIVDWLMSVKKSIFWEFIFNNYQFSSSNKFLYKNFSFHKTKKIGEKFSLISRARQAIANILGKHFPDIFPMFISSIIGLAFCFYINYLLAIIIIFGLVIYLSIIWKKLPIIEKYKEKEEKAYEKAFGDMHETANNIYEIKKNATEYIEEKKNYKNFLKKCFNISKVMVKLWSGNRFIQNIIITITRVTVFIVSVFLIIKGNITIGELTAVNGYAGMVFGPFVSISNAWLWIFTGIISINKAEKLLKEPDEIYDPENAIEIKDFKGIVEFRNVDFYYKKSDGNILNNINIKVKQGETIAFVGESGVGKSTAIDLIGAFYFPQKGKILIDGVNTKRLKLHDLRKNIAYVSQEITLFNDTIKNNIKYGSFNATKEEIFSASKKANCHDFIEKFPKKYKQVVGERGVKLSVGQKQRISIARAMLRDPKILILDEPTSALDAKSERVILKSLDNLMEGRTTFIIAHRLSTVRKADRIFVFDEGTIVESGKHIELMQIKNGVYRKFYEMHIGLGSM